MEEKILEILIRNYPNFASNGRVAKQITAEATKEMYPKKFMEWLVLNEKFLPEIHRDIDNNVLAWGFGDYESNDIQTYTIEYVFEYWKQNISK